MRNYFASPGFEKEYTNTTIGHWWNLRNNEDLPFKVCQIMNTDFDELKNKSQKRKFVENRQIFCYLMKELGYKVSDEYTASFLPIKRCNVRSSRLVCQDLIDTNKEYKQRVDNILQKFVG